MVNTKLLKSHLMLKGYTMQKFAKKIGISRASLSYKVNNIREFTSSEILAIKKSLKLSDEQVTDIFLNWR